MGPEAIETDGEDLSSTARDLAYRTGDVSNFKPALTQPDCLSALFEQSTSGTQERKKCRRVLIMIKWPKHMCVQLGGSSQGYLPLSRSCL